MRYSGILADFMGKRWWRGALENYVWDLAAGDGEKLRSALNARAESLLERIDETPAVVCLDRELMPSGRFLSPMTAVTLRPDPLAGVCGSRMDRS